MQIWVQSYKKKSTFANETHYYHNLYNKYQSKLFTHEHLSANRVVCEQTENRTVTEKQQFSEGTQKNARN